MIWCKVGEDPGDGDEIGTKICRRGPGDTLVRRKDEAVSMMLSHSAFSVLLTFNTEWSRLIAILDIRIVVRPVDEGECIHQ